MQPTSKQIDQTIQKNLKRLRKPGVLTVRPGQEIAGHQLTGKSAIVATVHTKKATLPKSERLPDKIGSIPVDVREATGHQRLRSHDPAAAALAQAFSRPERKEPEWPFEREMPSGNLLTSPHSDTQKTLATTLAKQPATDRALQSHAAKAKINYVPAPGIALVPMPMNTTITAHVSPDAALVTLEAFLDGTQHSLVIGMYDFTSGEILTKFKKVLTGAKTLQMVLDNPPPNRTRDQTDTQTVQELDQTLGNRAKIARALAGDDSLVNAVMFQTSYHIKVIVRDGTVVWLSSGNLNNSNQPDLTAPPTTEDRDWHVIIEDKELAKVFTAFLNQDFASASQHQLAQASADAAAVSDARAKLAAETNPSPPPPLKAAAKKGGFAAKKFQNLAVTITPVLTPDTLPGSTKGQYLSNMMKLIQSAQKKLYIQLQYIEASKGVADYDALLQAIADRITAGVEVRLIESLEFGEKWAEMMRTQGVDGTGIDLSANIWLQSNVHNKGFVVDSKTVVVSSQNFSPAGVQANRDAGVIIESPEIAGYFEPIFLSDLKNKAKPFAPQAAAAKKRAPAKKAPAAKKRAPAKK